MTLFLSGIQSSLLLVLVLVLQAVAALRIESEVVVSEALGVAVVAADDA